MRTGAIITGFTGLYAAVLIASFLKDDLTRNDFERFDDLRLSFLFFALFAALCALYGAAYRYRIVAARRALVLSALAYAALLLASFPVGSKDTFAYSFLGRIWGHHGANPFVARPESFPDDPWQAFLSGQPFSVYGPLFVWQTWLVDAIGGDSIWTAVWLHKLLATAALLASLWLARAVLDRARTDGTELRRLLLLLAWNPLMLFECAGAGHNDAMMVLLVLGAVWSWQARRPVATAGMLALSFWYKWYSVIFIPALLIETAKAAGWRIAARDAALHLVAIAAIGLVSLLALPGALPAILGEWFRPQKMVGIYPNELSPPLALLFWTMRAAGLFSTDAGFRSFDLIRFGTFVFAAAIVWLRQWRSTASAFAVVMESCFLIGLAAFMLLITQLWPWHLLTVVVFGVLSAREPFVLGALVLTVLGMLSYFLTFAVAALMLVAIAAALSVMRGLGSRVSGLG